MKKILVVVDMQNDFITGSLGTPEAVSIVDNVVNKIREGEWDHIFVTMDGHDDEYLKTQEGKKLPVEHCREETEGWRLNPKVAEVLDGKCRFIHKDTFGSTRLTGLLHGSLISDFNYNYTIPSDEVVRCMEGSIYELTLVGVCTDICVISNALLLKAYYPEMRIVVDASCCAGSSQLKHWEALDIMRSCQIDVINDEMHEAAKDLAKTIAESFAIHDELLSESED